jgi:hypothetical protein
MDEGQAPSGRSTFSPTSNGSAPRRARPRDVRGVGFPASGYPEFGGKALSGLTGQVEIPYPTIEAETRRRVERLIGCTLEQSYAEFTVELKNAVARMFDPERDDRSRPARHRVRGRKRWHIS